MTLAKRSRPLGPATLAEFYVHLHRKSSDCQNLFDPSWLCDVTHTGDTLQWSKKLLHSTKRAQAAAPFFSNFLDRLILLPPAQCQIVLATAVLLSRREAFRHCIDGGKIRALKASLGDANVAAVLKSSTIQKVPAKQSNWEMTSLLAEAMFHVKQTFPEPDDLVYEYIKIALPRHLPVLESNYDKETFERLLREVCGWNPEVKWLCG